MAMPGKPITSDISFETVRETAEGIKKAAARLKASLPLVVDREIAPMDIPAWLYHRGVPEKYYFRARNKKFELGGCGNGFKFDESYRLDGELIDEIFTLNGGRGVYFLYGGNFDSRAHANGVWADFPDRVVLIPREFIANVDGKHRHGLAFRIDAKSDIQKIIEETGKIFERAKGDSGPLEATAKLTAEIIDNHPDRKHWRKGVAETLQAISEGKVDKAVLSRQSHCHLSRDIDAVLLMEILKKQNRACFVALFQPADDRAFISLSPERLFRRKQTSIDTEAVSSTVPRGASADEDIEFEQELISSEKQADEHFFVVDGLTRTLNDILQNPPMINRTTVMKLDRVQHLYTRMFGILKEDIDDFDIIKALHPSPAVGGAPREEAVRLISEIEGFNRGWYAAPVGVIGKDYAELAVAIRSLLMDGSNATVFTGAGIVSGSDPDSEWSELDSKNILNPFMRG